MARFARNRLAVLGAALLVCLLLLVVLFLPNGLLDLRNRSRQWMIDLAPAGRRR